MSLAILDLMLSLRSIIGPAVIGLAACLTSVSRADGWITHEAALAYLSRVRSNPALVNKPIHPTKKSDYGALGTPVLLAAMVGDEATLRWLFEHKATPKTADHQAILLEAAGAYAKADAARASFDVLWSNGVRAPAAALNKVLDVALANGQFLVAGFLIDSKVPVAKSALGKTDWQRCLFPLYIGMPARLGDDGAPPTAHEASVAAFMSRLIAAGADPKFKDRNGDNLLYAVYRYPGLVRVLLEAGCDPNDINEGGNQTLGGKDYQSGATPLMLAAESARLDAVKLLLEHGANRDAESGEGKKALHYAELALSKCKSNEVAKKDLLTQIIALLRG